MALKTPYATVQQANSYLSNNDAWQDLSTSEKNVYLTNGRYYIDSTYTCSAEVDMTDIPEEYVWANSILAGVDVSNSIFAEDPTAENPIVKKRSKAGSVETEVEYAGNRSTDTSFGAVDPYPVVTSLLAEYCSRSNTGTNTIVAVSLVRD